MTKLYAKVVAIVLAFVSVLSIGGVFAMWVYTEGPIEGINQSLGLGIYVWTENDNSGDMTGEEADLTNRVVNIINGEVTTEDGKNAKEVLETIVKNRSDAGRVWGYNVNEIAADEAAELKTLLGLDGSSLTTIIKFIYGTSWNNRNTVVGYELFTTRVDLDGRYDSNKDGKVDETDDYSIPDEAFDKENGENWYIYPVNRTTFTTKTENGKTVYVADEVQVGYSRTIEYYETATTQKAGSRTYDVAQWSTGLDRNNAVQINKTGDFYIYNNIGQMTPETPAYFYYDGSTGRNATPDATMATWYKIEKSTASGNSYFAMKYDESIAGAPKPSASNPVILKFTVT